MITVSVDGCEPEQTLLAGPADEVNLCLTRGSAAAMAGILADETDGVTVGLTIPAAGECWDLDTTAGLLVCDQLTLFYELQRSGTLQRDGSTVILRLRNSGTGPLACGELTLCRLYSIGQGNAYRLTAVFTLPDEPDRSLTLDYISGEVSWQDEDGAGEALTLCCTVSSWQHGDGAVYELSGEPAEGEYDHIWEYVRTLWWQFT